MIDRSYRDWLYDSEVHYLSCAQLPDYATAERVFVEHVQRITEARLLMQNLEVKLIHSAGCAGKGEIIVFHGSRADRKLFKSIFGSTFFGIPYSMTNI